jgi:hypothetical protein
MKPFKFFQKNDIQTIGCLSSRYFGQIQWMYREAGIIFYMQRSYNNGVVTEEIKTMTIRAHMRYFNSYDHFMEVNRNKIIFVYEFVDNTNIENMIHYNQDNFDDMPRDRPLIFRGVVYDNEF